MVKISRKAKKRFWVTLSGLFLLLNLVACFHAYKFTHFAASDVEKTKPIKALSIGNKLKSLLFGINNPRPINKTTPNLAFETIQLQSRKRIECWYIKIPESKGTVAIFHGFSGNKSLMLDKSEEFNKLGYNTFLVDFIGTGGSEGNQTTIGYKEAQDVKVALDYLKQQNEPNIILFGTSMGAAAILCAAKEYGISPAAAILECPFGSMYKTTCARFQQMHVPCFPMAGLLVFWGGVENGFWAFAHNPQEYATSVKFPVLLLYGEKDKEVSRAETDLIFKHLGGPKVLYTFPEAGHENYLVQYKTDWINDVSAFLASNSNVIRSN